MRCKCGHGEMAHVYLGGYKGPCGAFPVCGCERFEVATDTTEVMPVAVPAPELEATGPTQASLAKTEETVQAQETWSVIAPVRRCRPGSGTFLIFTSPKHLDALLDYLSHEALGYGERGRLILELMDDIKDAMATTVVDRLVD